jgi:hypothetical protein
MQEKPLELVQREFQPFVAPQETHSQEEASALQITQLSKQMLEEPHYTSADLNAQL